jgi:precorrin-6A synthase
LGPTLTDAAPLKLGDVGFTFGAVVAWHDERVTLYGQLLRDQVLDGECGAFLVWGDPSLYDSILRIIAAVQARGTGTV